MNEYEGAIDQRKVRYRAYQRVAQQWGPRLEHYASPDIEVRVPDHPQVQETEDGAYVEAMIWVPRSAIDPKESV